MGLDGDALRLQEEIEFLKQTIHVCQIELASREERMADIDDRRRGNRYSFVFDGGGGGA